MDNRKSLWNLFIYLGIPIPITIIMASAYGNVKLQKAHKYSEVVGYFKSQQVIDYTMDLGSDKMQISLEDDTNVTYTVSNVAIMCGEIHSYIEQYSEGHPDKNMRCDLKRPAETSWLANLIPTTPSLAGMLVFWWFMIKCLNTSMGDAGKQIDFGEVKVKQMADEKCKTTFVDVAGAGEEKEKLCEIIEFPRNPKKHSELGTRISKGVLLAGPPDTGEMPSARAIAGKMGVLFFSISGSDFVGMFVGVGASHVRDLFDQAKKDSLCITSIDEIDAVGRQRGTGLGGDHGEREQTLNQLLAEMDSFGANGGVIMIAATNRSDILGPALMRSGCLDRQIVVDYLDIKGREEVLKVHACDKLITPDMNLKTIVKSAVGFIGADLENLPNEAALLSVRRNLRTITAEEIEEATIKVVIGTEKKSRTMMKKEKTLTAYHGGGHAVATYFCLAQDPMYQISIILRGMAGSYMMQLPAEDRSYKYKKEVLEDLIMPMGDRVAEVLVPDDISTGASNDIERATRTACVTVTKYSISEVLGIATYGSDNSEPFLGCDMGHMCNHSENTAAAIDQKVKDILTDAYDGATKILSDYMDKLREVTKYLYQNERMSDEDFQKLAGGTALPAATGQIPSLPKLNTELPQVEFPSADETAE